MEFGLAVRTRFNASNGLCAETVRLIATPLQLLATPNAMTQTMKRDIVESPAVETANSETDSSGNALRYVANGAGCAGFVLLGGNVGIETKVR